MRSLSFINFTGVLVLVILCAAQWQNNRQYNHEINRLESIRISQAELLSERNAAIKQHLEDTRVLKSQILELTDSLRTTEGQFRLETQKVAQLEIERNQLRENIEEWAAAVENRDLRIAENQEQIQELAQLQNEAVRQYNALAEDCNEVVKLLNERTAAYNELIQQMKRIR